MTKQNKLFLLDGVAVSMHELIEAAKQAGYVSDCIYYTSEAACILKEQGHTVAPAPDSRKLS